MVTMSYSLPKIVCIAGFGDNSTMFAPLLQTSLTETHEIIPFDLPGFGAPPLNVETTLENLSEALTTFTKQVGASIVLAHSVASIIAALSAGHEGSPIKTILSLEGNLTADDAYFSGTAANYNNATTFREAFLARLDKMAENQPIINRYRSMVCTADPMALWELGTEAHNYSIHHVPGDELLQSAQVAYLYNPDNVPETSLKWLSKNNIAQVRLDGATHWKSVDQPTILAKKIRTALSTFS